MATQTRRPPADLHELLAQIRELTERRLVEIHLWDERGELQEMGRGRGRRWARAPTRRGLRRPYGTRRSAIAGD